MHNETLYNFTCGHGLDAFHTRYVSIHGYVSLLVCTFGSIANGLNIAVLSRKEMSSPTNAILTGLAVADLLVMIEYIPYVIHTHLYHRPKRDTYTYGWALFVLFHSNYAQIFHTISIWLTVTLAVWRYIAVAYPQKNREWCSYRRTIMAIVAAYVIVPLLCSPMYLTTEIVIKNRLLDANDCEVNLTARQLHGKQDTNSTNAEPKNTTLYFVAMTESARAIGFEDLNLWVYGVVIKLIPCLALTIFSRRLILALVEAKKRRKKLTTTTMLKMEESASVAEGKKRKRKHSRLIDKEKQTDRTTKMLLAVLLLFLLTEFPQGMMGLLSGLLGKPFFNTCYLKLGEVMDILALINSAINFILYCAMSRQFRQTFNQLFCRWKLFGRWSPVPQHAENNNGHTTNHTVTQVTQV
ncbi:sex peptide receptor [Copidosoma floridanum]|uniref:sex peptide receptor n=1 Tax=Copidosoma floridanum TaxID=29053 RepID=UPI0006C9B2A0|nr:sex peptide receptor [Copidosoma floridanum]